jgi:Ca-activated chloride channel family protein
LKKRRALVHAVAVSLVLGSAVTSATWSSGRAQQAPTFRGGIDVVSFGVTAFDRKGGFLTDLRAEDVEVFEDGRQQSLKFFIPCAAQGDGGAEAPLHLGALFDISGSMEADLAFARGAAIKFLNSLSEAHDFTLVDFDTEVRVARFSQAEFARLVERIRSRKADGNTALWDATGVYLDGASLQDGRKVLILYTDGGDNASNINFDELLDLLKASDVTVHAIGFLEHQPTSLRMEQRLRLQKIADLTGGQAFFPYSMKDLDGVYQKVAAEIDAQYTLGYLSTNAKQDGTWRKVEIKVVRPGLKDIRIRTRQGYFAPLKVPPPNRK